ncbi:phage late control D family protein [Acidocella sp.]|uniref:phage late control D family protein n=1 Tax=Acidocella sp. TaxID=50710 RepID=UPI00260E9E6B|nr:hypothetical protein [Acidocella sp.]
MSIAIGGVEVPGGIAVTIDAVGCFSASRFRLVVSTGYNAAFGADYFGNAGGQRIGISLIPDGGGLVPLLSGVIDNVTLDFRNDVAVLSGRDLSALLIDTDVAETFQNQTASQIAETIAARHGLAAQVQPTQTMVGQYYDTDHARNVLGLNARIGNEWGLLCQLAEAEGYEVAVWGQTLMFQPPSATVAAMLPCTGFSSLEVDVACAVPQAVQVKSWNCRQKRAIAVSAGGAGRSATSVRPNLGADEALAMARNQLGMAMGHGRMLVGTMPGEMVLQPGVRFGLYGTGSGFDAVYGVMAVRRMIDQAGGYQQIVRAQAVSA